MQQLCRMTTFLFDTDQRCNLMICDAFLLYIMYLLAAAYLLWAWQPFTDGRKYISHLICTLISENEGLEKLRSASDLRKISVPAHLNFFSVCHLSFFQNLYHRSEKNSGDKLKKNSGVQELKFF